MMRPDRARHVALGVMWVSALGILPSRGLAQAAGSPAGVVSSAPSRQRVRVRVAGEGAVVVAGVHPPLVLVGTSEQIDADTLRLLLAAGPVVLVPRESLLRLDVSLGRRSRLVGALAGAVRGGVLFSLLAPLVPVASGAGDYRLTARPFFVLGGFGAVGGAVAGLTSPGERWRRLR